jgi:hypothetical protein
MQQVKQINREVALQYIYVSGIQVTPTNSRTIHPVALNRYFHLMPEFKCMAVQDSTPAVTEIQNSASSSALSGGGWGFPGFCKISLVSRVILHIQLASFSMILFLRTTMSRNAGIQTYHTAFYGYLDASSQLGRGPQGSRPTITGCQFPMYVSNVPSRVDM